MVKGRVVHGDDLLYRFFQDILAKEPDRFAAVPQLMLEAMAIWFPVSIYHDWPVLLPWVVRDPACRGKPAEGIADEWSAPDRRGYLRDDNSLIKALPRSLSVRTPAAGRLRGARMGSEFVAAHVWRKVRHRQLATRLPLLNSFVPNLVWLPSQVAKLTDRESGMVQATLQSMAFAIYRNAPVADHLKDVVAEAWGLIPEPQPITVELSSLNWFEPTDRFLSTRWSRLNTVLRALEMLEAGEPLTGKTITSRYTVGLPGVATVARRQLLTYLKQFQP